jgi:hypothetical protein
MQFANIIDTAIIGRDLHQFGPSKHVDDQDAGLLGQHGYGKHNDYHQPVSSSIAETPRHR